MRFFCEEEWDVKKIHSTTTQSNGSAVSPQLYGKELQHIFDYKVGKLRALLTADEDITAELDHVVYRLVKLALKTSKERNTPPPATWLQCKLLDLLTLTERSIERRKRHYFNKNPSAIKPMDFQENGNVNKLEVSHAEDSEMVKEIVDKYCHLIQPSENADDFNSLVEPCINMEGEDDLSIASNGMVNIFDNNDDNSSSPTRVDRNVHFKSRARERESLSGIQWKNDNYSGVSSSGDTDHSFKTEYRSSSRRAGKRCRSEMDNVYHRVNIGAKRRRLSKRDYKINENCGVRNERKRLQKSFIGKKNLRWYILKNNISSVKYEHYKIGIKKIVQQDRPLNTFIKPVSTINLRQRGVNKDLLYTLKNDLINSNNGQNQESIAVTEESCILEIVTDGMNETIALRRTIATDAYDGSFEIKERLSPSSNEIMPEEKIIVPEDVESRHIFLYDINEPSTSKGIRHVNMDAQCGSDNVLSPVLSPITSLHRIPGIIANNVTDGYSANAKPREEYLECNVHGNKEKLVEDNILNYKIKSNGIQIKDSEVLLHNDENISIEVNLDSDFKTVFGSNLKNTVALEIVKVPNVMESKKFYSEFVKNSDWNAVNDIETITKPIYEKNDIVELMSDVNKEDDLKNIVPFPETIEKDIKRKLICGGIFVHSYKDKTACEDILYQGKWQRTALRLVKTSPNHVVPAIKVKNYNKEVIPQKCLEKSRVKSQKCINYKEKIKIETLKVRKVSSKNKERPVVVSTPIKCSDKNLTMASSKLSNVMCRNKMTKHNMLREISKPLVSSIKENKTLFNLKKKNTSQYFQSRKCKYISKSLEKIIDEINDVEKICIRNDDLVTSSKTNFKQELLKYVCDPSHDITYSVFRNQIENKQGNDVEGLVRKEINDNHEDKTTSNYQSANSSCSSNNSIATIKQLSPLNKDLQSKTKFISTKSLLRLKSAKKSSPIRNDTENCSRIAKRSAFMFENKENYPESSISNAKTIKERTHDHVKSIRMPQNTICNGKSNVSNARNKKNSDHINQNLNASSGTLSKKAMQDFASNKQSCAKTLLEVDPQNQDSISEFHKIKSTQCKSEEINSRNNKSALENADIEKIGNDCINMYDEIKTMLEERLNCIDTLFKTEVPSASTDNRKITLDDCNNICDKSSFDKSVVDDSGTNSWRSGPEPVYVDLISFKSFASISGYSEYYYADNKFNSTLDSLKILTPPVRSVHDIFERNDQLRIANSVGLMDTPGFSRFSINERMIGDQPDYVNLIDSETGSLAHFVEVRRATSEEVFTSGRSSDTYVSCQVDDDNVVPHWLFRMNNRQNSDEEQSTPALPIPLPTVAPQLDVNGNIAEQGIGVGAGAGDGRGIHSDQGSSGRDTSLSSTDTSSGQQSEALLVDPPGYASNMEFLREPSSRPFLQIPCTGVSNASFRTAQGSEHNNIYNINEASNRNALNHEMITSDRDADVSSLDTDIADFSDN